MKSKFIASACLVASISLSYSFEVITQDLSVADGWETITLECVYNDPIIVTGALTNNDQDSVMAEIGSITSDSFQVRIRDWGAQQLHSASETVTIIVMERGETTYGGLTIIADKINFESTTTFDANGRSGSMTFPLPAPIVKQPAAVGAWNFGFLGQPIFNDGVLTPLHVRSNNQPTATDGFTFRFEKGDRNSSAVQLDEMHYLVVQAGVTDNTEPVKIQSLTSPRLYKEVLKPLSFDTSIVDPVILLDAPLIRGGDNTAIRYQNLTEGSVNVKTDEGPGYNEVHTTEEVTAIVIGDNPDYVAPDDFQAITIRRNLAVGGNATAQAANSVAIGENAMTKGENSLAVGANATTTDGVTLAVDGNSVLSGNLDAGNTTVDNLTVNGSTTLNGDVTITTPQGDLSMGVYGESN